ncbi:MAG: exodeoxyribonuclease VII large subunit, partial [Clostridiales bacterium]|nr:exodeoxyribonuclease VII large subunit [Clostridiales bacterium]
ADSRKRNVEGQMGLFGMLEEEGNTEVSVPVPKLQEMSRGELMAMEKETTGLYLSGHPMDDYRAYLKNTRVMTVASLMNEERQVDDGAIVSVAGIVQKVKMKTTRNNSVMAYVTLEDDTGSMEMLAFSNTLTQCGSNLQEGKAVVVVGRLSIRDEKDPQIVINRARPIEDYANGEVPQEQAGGSRVPGERLYLRLPSETVPQCRKTKAILNMFPGNRQVILYFADTKSRQGTLCDLDGDMIGELKRLLGGENVVVK